VDREIDRREVIRVDEEVGGELHTSNGKLWRSRCRGIARGGGVDARPYLSPERSARDSWDGLALFI